MTGATETELAPSPARCSAAPTRSRLRPVIVALSLRRLAQHPAKVLTLAVTQSYVGRPSLSREG